MSKEIEIAFGGGAIRGFAHVGALAAIEQLGYRITAVSGASIGAIIAALVSWGYSAKQIYDITVDLDWNKFYRPSWKLTGLFSNRNIEKLMEEHRADEVIPCVIPTTDLYDGEVIKNGPDPKAIAISCSVPGVFAPSYGLVDGCVKQNVPIDMLPGKNRKIGLSCIHDKVDKDLKNMVDVLARVNDIYCLEQLKNREDIVHLVDFYVGPLEKSIEVKKKLLSSGYTAMYQYLTKE